jgi:hypothetical protein
MVTKKEKRINEEFPDEQLLKYPKGRGLLTWLISK